MTRLGLYLIPVFFAACAAKPLMPGADSVMVSKVPVHSSCEFVGEVSGSQGNFWTAEFTRDRDLVAGARNEARNTAHGMGANYVLIETESISENTANDSLGGAYSVVLVGNAYRCPAGWMTGSRRTSGGQN